MRKLDRPAVRLGLAAFVLFVGWAGDAVRNTVGWWVYGAVVLGVLAAGLILVLRNRAKLSLMNLPIPLVVFSALIVASVAWSFYRPSTLLGTATTLMTTIAGLGVALALSWPELLRVLGWVLRAILGLSFVFEFVVSAFVRHPVLPVWAVPDDPDHIPKLLYWSRNLLFDLGKIQGIVGNSSLLAMVAFVGLIVFAIQLASRSVTRLGGVFWILVAAFTIVLTQSATIVIGLAVVALVTVIVLVLRRTAGTRADLPVRALILVLTAGAVVSAIVLRGPLLTLLGKSGTLTGRAGIWEAVIGLAEQRPVAGWGWVSYWVPWAPPFDHLIVRGGVQVLHAHNAWLDVWLQLGVIGLAVVGGLVVSTLVRSWQQAIDRPVVSVSEKLEFGAVTGALGDYRWISLLPLLVLVAQLVQSLAESRILIEGGWMLLVIWAVKTKMPRPELELQADAAR